MEKILIKVETGSVLLQTLHRSARTLIVRNLLAFLVFVFNQSVNIFFISLALFLFISTLSWVLWSLHLLGFNMNTN